MVRNGLLDSVKPLDRGPISLSIMNLIIDYLLTKKLKPGDQLPTEMEFAEQLRVGKGSVREAIKMLSSIGVVEIKRGVGTFISNSVPDSVMTPAILELAFDNGTPQELVEFRVFIDTALALLVAQKATEGDIRRLEEANQRLREAGEKFPGETKKIRDLDHDFHKTLLKIGNNRFVSKIGTAVYRLFLSAMENSIRSDPTSPATSHELILEALRRRNNELIVARIADSYSRWPLGSVNSNRTKTET